MVKSICVFAPSVELHWPTDFFTPFLALNKNLIDCCWPFVATAIFKIAVQAFVSSENSSHESLNILDYT